MASAQIANSIIFMCCLLGPGRERAEKRVTKPSNKPHQRSLHALEPNSKLIEGWPLPFGSEQFVLLLDI
jgi:hypothetical protein